MQSQTGIGGPDPGAPSPTASGALFDRLLAVPGVVVMVGGIDTGKTTFGIELARRAAEVGIPTAIVDADVGQSTVGPPTTVGLKLCSGMEVVSTETVRSADGLAFVGSVTPSGHMLRLVTGTAKLVQRARQADCRLVIVDTTGLVSGIAGQSLKLSKMDLIAPDFVLGFARGGELEPLIGHTRRFTGAEVMEVEVGSDIPSRPADERVSFREAQFSAYFRGGLSRWRVKPQVLMPSPPPEFDLALLDGIVVGMDDGKGSCVGIGVLEHSGSDQGLRMVSPVAEGVRGLRLGSIRLTPEGRSRGPVSLRHLFQTE